jgi:hypothetical protein
MKYEFPCPSCNALLRAKPDLAGSIVACPKCSAQLAVPAPPAASDGKAAEEKKVRPATDKQKAYARELGLSFDDDIDRRAISKLIDGALGKEELERYDRLNALQDKENELRAQFRAEIMAECDADDPRMSVATKDQILEGLNRRQIGAILVTFEYGVLGGVEDLTGEKFSLSTTDDIDEGDIKTILASLGVAMMRRSIVDDE